jgi:hypothetical protein
LDIWTWVSPWGKTNIIQQFPWPLLRTHCPQSPPHLYSQFTLSIYKTCFIIAFHLTIVSEREKGWVYCLHFTEEETKAQKNETTH